MSTSWDIVPHQRFILIIGHDTISLVQPGPPRWSYVAASLLGRVSQITNYQNYNYHLVRMASYLQRKLLRILCHQLSPITGHPNLVNWECGFMIMELDWVIALTRGSMVFSKPKGCCIYPWQLCNIPNTVEPRLLAITSLVYGARRCSFAVSSACTASSLVPTIPIDSLYLSPFLL